MAQVSCQVVEPKQARPSDGTLFINVELSPMACPSFEPGRLSDFGVEINRLLERCLKESRCLDTESLCIVSGERVSLGKQCNDFKKILEFNTAKRPLTEWPDIFLNLEVSWWQSG